MDNEHTIRKQLIENLHGRNAHVDFDGAIANLPDELWGKVPDGLPYSVWQLVEHIRLAQWDIVEFSENPSHKSPPWPEGYWPNEKAPKNSDAPQKSIDQFHTDLNRMISMVSDFDNSLYKPFPHGNGQNLLREAMLVANHNSYHVGEIVVVRRLLNSWPA